MSTTREETYKLIEQARGHAKKAGRVGAYDTRDIVSELADALEALLPSPADWEYGLYEEDPHRERERPHRAYNGAHLVSENKLHVEGQWRRGHPSIKFVCRRKAGPWESVE